MADDSNSNKFTYFLIGAGIGAVVALLFAPKSGRELRGDIKDATQRGTDYARENARMLGTKASEFYSTGREKAAHLYESGRDKAQHAYESGRERTSGLIESGREALSEQRNRLAAAVEAGKRAYQEKKTEVAALEAKLEAESAPEV